MTTDNLLELLLTIAVRVGGAALVLLVGHFLARLLRGWVSKLLQKPHVAVTIGPSMVRLLSEASYFILLALTVGLCLIILGVPVNYVVTASVIILVIIAVALQQSLANFAATVIILFFQPFRRDELIQTMGYTGTVQEILLFNTVLEMGDKRLVSLPNSKIQDNGVVNYTRMGVARTDVVLTISYDADLDHVRLVVCELAAGDKRILTDPPFQVSVDGLGENGVLLKVQPWVSSDDYWNVAPDLRERIKTRFDAEGIAFALPQRNIHITSEGEVNLPATDDGRLTTDDGQ
jgi:small conductance mechanosensitive channel